MAPGAGGVNESEPDSLGRRLDPDRAAAAARQHGRGSPPPVIDTRPYRRAIGFFGLALVLAVSAYLFLSRGVQSAGVKAGSRLHFFAAPLASSTLNGDANLNPPCTLARHDPRALNICLLAAQTALVLAFFDPGADNCKRQVDTLQAVSRQFTASDVQFAAVAVRAGHGVTAALVRSHHWTLPVAYDADGAVATLYDVSACPILELAYRGGIVADRLIGDNWLRPTAVAARVHGLLRR
jgi:peroxiredoxin